MRGGATGVVVRRGTPRGVVEGVFARSRPGVVVERLDDSADGVANTALGRGVCVGDAIFAGLVFAVCKVESGSSLFGATADDAAGVEVEGLEGAPF
jgi:hypothetical protein